MTDPTSFVDETQRQIQALGASTVRLTLMSVSAPVLPPSILESAVRTASASLDVVGRLADDSLGLLSLWSVGPNGGAGVEHRFLPRMQAVLAPLARRRDIGTVRFRAVHRWACELTDAYDLFDSLFDAPAVVLSVPQPTSSMPFLPGPLPRRVAALLFPWHTPRIRDQGRAQRL